MEATMTLEQQQALALARARRRRAESKAAAPEKSEPSTAGKIAADPFMRFALGAAEPIRGAVQRLSESGPMFGPLGAMQLIAMKARPELDKGFAETRKMASEVGTPGFDAMGMAGNMMSPMALGAGKFAAPATMLGRTALGAGIGATGGATMPAESTDEARKNALIGLGAGAVLPGAVHAAGSAGQWLANNVVRPVSDLFTKQGPTNIARKYIRDIVSEPNMPVVMDKVRGAKELIPGSKPTVAEALAGVPEGSPVNALQGITSRTPGGPSAAFGNRLLDQEGAVTAAKAARSVESAANYKKAFDTAINQVKADPDLAVLAQNPFFKDAVPAAMKLAKAKGLTPKDNLSEFLHDVKLGMDRKLKGGIGEEALSAAQYRQIQQVKEKLVEWLGKKNPDYEVGRAAHAKASKAISDDIARRDVLGAQLQPTNLGGGLNIAEQTRPHTPNLLNRVAMLANFALSKAGKGVEPKVDAALTEIMLNPAKFSEVMSKLPAKTRVDVDKMFRATNALVFGAQQ